jgi:GTPase SAR1 family protein
MNSGGRSTVSGVHLCNLALVGDGAVGKSSIIRAFCTDGFDRVYQQVGLVLLIRLDIIGLDLRAYLFSMGADTWLRLLSKDDRRQG